MKKVISIIALLICLATLTACSNIVKFEYTDGKLVNTKTKETYTAAPVGYEPCGVGTEYGIFGEFSLYKVAGLDGEEFDAEDWITEEYSGSATTVFYGENVTLVPFEEMTPDVCYVCEEDVNVISVATITDEETLNALCSALESEGDTILPLTDITTTYSLKFYSADHPQYFYSVLYCVCESGNYVFKRGANFATNVGDLLTSYLGSVAE